MGVSIDNTISYILKQVELGGTVDISETVNIESSRDYSDLDVDRVWHERGLVNGTLDYDLSALPKSIFGPSLNTAFNALHVLYIFNTSVTDPLVVDFTAPGSLTGPGSNTTKIQVGPRGLYVATSAAGWSLPPSILRLTSSAAVNFDIFVGGAA